jgi:hypothetical protein
MTMRMGRVAATKAVSIVGLAVLAFALWALVLSPRIASAQVLKQQASQIESANIGLVKTHQELLAMSAQAPQLALEAQHIFSRMPESAQLPVVLRQINSAAVRAGISARNVQVINATIPESVDAKAGTPPTASTADTSGLGVHLATMTIVVTVTGTDRQRLAFLTLLLGLDRGLLITDTSAISDGTSKSNGNLTVTGTMFVLESRLPDLVSNAQRIITEARQEALKTQAAS